MQKYLKGTLREVLPIPHLERTHAHKNTITTAGKNTKTTQKTVITLRHTYVYMLCGAQNKLTARNLQGCAEQYRDILLGHPYAPKLIHSAPERSNGAAGARGILRSPLRTALNCVMSYVMPTCWLIACAQHVAGVYFWERSKVVVRVLKALAVGGAYDPETFALR